MSLKDVIERDNQAVFLNVNDFAEAHVIDGREAACIVQNVGVNDDFGAERYGGEYYGGLSRSALLVNVCKDDLGGVPKYGQIMTLDGKEYVVQGVTDDMGIVSITLEASER